VNVKQINVIPNLAIAGNDILSELRFFQLYRILSVVVRFVNLDPVNYTQGATTVEIPYVYEVPLLNNNVPVAAETAYLAFKNVKYHSFRSDFNRRFTPIANATADETGPWLKSPKLPVSDTTRNHFGMSFLFVKPSNATSTMTLRAVITMRIALYSYDGNGGLGQPTAMRYSGQLEGVVDSWLQQPR